MEQLIWRFKQSPQRTPKRPPEKAAYIIVDALFAEFMPSVSDDWEYLLKSSRVSPKISFVDFQMEALIFCLHCLDWGVFIRFGREYRDTFMDNAFSIARKRASVAIRQNKDGFLEWLDDRYNTRQLEYGRMKLQEKGYILKDTLFWEYAKRTCQDIGVYNPTIITIICGQAAAIYGGRCKVVQKY